MCTVTIWTCSRSYIQTVTAENVLDDLRNFKELHDYFLSMFNSMCNIESPRQANMLSFVQVVVNHLAYCYLKYADKFTRELIKERLKDKLKKEGGNDLADMNCFVIRNIQYMRFEPIDYIMLLNMDPQNKEKFHVLYLKNFILFDSPVLSVKKFHTQFFFHALFYGDFSRYFSESKPLSLFSAESIFGDMMKDSMDVEQQRELLCFLQHRLSKNQSMFIHVRGEYAKKESNYRHEMILCPATCKSLKFIAK
uniref:Uncharacterized protein n=1 Tax=Hanusia phi TaxID=3032 RepID=A0A7S0E0Q6_9CRYP|mmetsp:Transcript_14323/g.32949  ORF Transcript_14323/g.32949 Transcript_14323/m.32949 type:complete len:251 (+) Transcript_14323:743-1495(+)